GGGARRDQQQVGDVGSRHQALVPVEAPAAAVALRGGPRQERRQLVALLDQRGTDDQRAVADPRQDTLALRRAPERVDRHCRPDHRVEVGQRRDRAPDLLEDQTGLDDPEPLPPTSSARGTPSRPAWASRFHSSAPTRSSVASIARSRSRVSDSRRISSPRSAMARWFSSSSRSMRSTPVPQCRGTRGMPRPKSAIRSRWTSFVPPPNVRNSVPWYARSSRPRSGASLVPRSTPAEP